MKEMDEQIMLKYLQEECSAEEKRIFTEWLSQSDENRKIFYQTKALWNHKKIKQFGTKEQITKAEERLNRSIKALERPIRTIPLNWLKYAAVIALTITLSTILYTKLNRTNSATNLLTVEVSKNGDSRLVTLSDGSRIWLNNNSSLTYPAKFSKDQRSVTFKGEGYFEIAHDSLHPFVVETNNMHVKVLGTSFNVRAFPSEKTTKTTLLEGKVLIQNNKGTDLGLLAPGQMAEINKSSHQLSIKEVDTTLCASWRYGHIAFEDASLSDITTKLTELYDVHFEFKLSQTDKTTYKFNFQKSQSINDIVEMLSFITPFDYQIEENKIVVKEKL